VLVNGIGRGGQRRPKSTAWAALTGRQRKIGKEGDMSTKKITMKRE
jgi:hypothetical protein